MRNLNLRGLKVLKNYNPNFNRELIRIDTYNGYSLSIISPIKKQNKKTGNYSSALIR